MEAFLPPPPRLRLEGGRNGRHHADRPAARAGLRAHPGAEHPRFDRRHRVRALRPRGRRPAQARPADRRGLQAALGGDRDGTPQVIEIEIDNRSGEAIDEEGARELARSVLAAEGVETGELGLVFVGPDESRALKQEHLGIDEATDALAFPIDALDELPEGVPRQLGDVVVCPDVCALEESSAEPKTPGGRPRTPAAPAGADEWRTP